MTIWIWFSSEKENRVCRPLSSSSLLPHKLDLSRDHTCASCFLEDEGQPQRQDWLTGGVGLNMNYSIIFTEISSYPETSILLQIIRIIHMINLDYASIHVSYIPN